METIPEKLGPLLGHLGMDPAAVDMKTMTKLYLGQMRIGLYGGFTSIPMRPSYLAPASTPSSGEAVAVAELSPREIRTALLRFSDGKPELTYGESFPLPGAEYPAPFEDLIFGIVSLLEPLLEHCQRVCLCHPFPMELGPDGEGFITRFYPGIRISGYEGKGLRSALQAELSAAGYGDRQLVLIPTAAAALQSGRLTQAKAPRHLGLYWDEGVDCCFSIPKSAILKLKSGENQLMLLSCGSGSFTGVPIGPVDLAMDRDSDHPGEDLLSKMVSIRNLGELYRAAMIKAVEANLLSFMCGRDFLSLRKLELSALLAFLENPKGDHFLAQFCSHEEGDRAYALAIGRALLERAAMLLVANLAAALELTGAGQREEEPCFVSLSGEAFQSSLLTSIFEDIVRSQLKERLGLYVSLYHDPAAPLIGAAASAFGGSSGQ